MRQVPHRGISRPPSANARTTTISSGLGASATETVMVSKWSKDQASSLCPSGTSMVVAGVPILTFEGMTDFPPPTASRIGFPSMGWLQAPPGFISPLSPTTAALPYDTTDRLNSAVSASANVFPISRPPRTVRLDRWRNALRADWKKLQSPPSEQPMSLKLSPSRKK
jgi:hypothetical protein